MRRFIVVLILSVIGIVGFIGGTAVDGKLLQMFERTSPTITANKNQKIISDTKPFKIVVNDFGAGLKSVKISNNGKIKEIFNISSSNIAKPTVEIKIDPKEFKLPQGDSTFEVTAVDNTFWANSISRKKTLNVDTIPPSVSAVNYIHRADVGGSSFVLYTADPKDIAKSGIECSGKQFLGLPATAFNADIPKDKNTFVGICGLTSNENTDIKVFAYDKAGNKGTDTVSANVVPKQFVHDKMNLNRKYLYKVLNRLLPVYESEFGKSASFSGGENLSDTELIDLYKFVNRDLRAKNIQQIKAINSNKKVSNPLWIVNGKATAFKKPMPAQLTASFGEKRTYFLGETNAGKSVHEGYDLAQVSASKVVASHRGIVVHASELGIYGKAVIIDHGAGIASVYGHLSSIAVGKGQRVEQGQKIARTGATGLAGGDHLHFEIRVQGEPVSPREWFDQNWIKTRIEQPLAGLMVANEQSEVEVSG